MSRVLPQGLSLFIEGVCRYVLLILFNGSVSTPEQEGGGVPSRVSGVGEWSCWGVPLLHMPVNRLAPRPGVGPICRQLTPFWEAPEMLAEAPPCFPEPR